MKEALNEKETAIQEANVALTNLPLEVTLEDKEQVEEARELVNKALELGAEENDFVNLWKLTDAEAKIAELEEEAAEAEAVQAVIDAIDALPEEITLEDAEAVADARAAYDALTEEQQELVTNVDVLEAAETKIAELEEEAAKKVTVTKIVKVEKDKVTVEIKPYDKDRFGEEIKILDNNGNKVAVKPVDIAAGDIEVVFEFVTPFEDDDFEGVWTVGGIEKDFDLENNLEAFKEETDQLKFVEVLNELGIENVEVANIPTYMGDARTNFLKELKEDKKDLTVEAIQEFINEVNAKVEEEGTEAEVKEKAAKAVVDAYVAKNDVALKIALENDVFERFNVEWLAEYKTEFGTAIKEGSTVENIQTKLDVANTAKLKEINVADSGSEVVDRAKLNEYKELIDTYAKKDKDGNLETDIAKIDKDIDIQLAIVDVREATTPTRLKPALENLAELTKGETTKFEMKDYKDENAKYYINGIAVDELAKDQPSSAVDGIKKADVKNVTDVSTVITNVNAAVTNAEGAMEERISTVAVSIANREHDGKTSGKTWLLGYSVKIDLAEEQDFKNAESVVAELYKGKELLGKMELRDPAKHEGKTIWGTIDVYGDYVSTSWAHEWNGELTDRPDNVKVTVKFADGAAVKEEELTISDDNMQPFYLVLANRAETAEDMNDVLLKLAEIKNNDYLNVPRADRQFVAEKVLAARNAVEDTKKFADYDALAGDNGALKTAIGARTAALEAVSKLEADSDISAVIAALNLVDPEGFAKMSVADKAEIAEAFFLGLTNEEGDFNSTFRTLVEIKEAAGL